MSIYGKILFEHQSFQDLISPDSSSNTRNTLAELFLEGGPLKDEFDNIDNELDTKVDKVEGERLITAPEIEKLANLQNYDDTQVNNNINSVQSAIIAEARTRAEEDTKLRNQLTGVQNLANSTKNTVDNLMGTKEDKEEIENLMNSLKTQLGENSVAKLLARVQYLEDVLFSEEYDLIIGEIDDNQATEPSVDNMNIVYDGGLVTQKGENE